MIFIRLNDNFANQETQLYPQTASSLSEHDATLEYYSRLVTISHFRIGGYLLL